MYMRERLICFLDRWHYAHVICRVRCAQLCIAGDHLCACSYVLRVCISVWCRTQGIPINIYQCVFVCTRIWQGQDVLRSLQTVVFVSHTSTHTHIHTRATELTNVIYITILHVQCTIILYYYYHHYNIMMNVWTFFFVFRILTRGPTISDYYRHYHRRKPECREGVTYNIITIFICVWTRVYGMSWCVFYKICIIHEYVEHPGLRATRYKSIIFGRYFISMCSPRVPINGSRAAG